MTRNPDMPDMPDSNDHHADLDELLGELCDGTIAPEGFAQLQSMLVASPEARRRYIHMMELHADLAWSDGALALAGSMNEADSQIVTNLARELNLEPTGASASFASSLSPSSPAAVASPSSPPAPSSPTSPSSPPAPLRRITRIATAAALLLVPALIAYFFLTRPAPPAALPGEFAPVATLTLPDSATLADATITDSPLAPGRVIDLLTGRADLHFADGTQVTLGATHGRSSLRIESPSHATLLAGEMTAHVPPGAAGFTVDTPSLRVIDLGTRFAISVPDKGDTQVHVFEGAVQVQARPRLPRVYFNFDDPNTITDPFSNRQALMQGTAVRAKGIIGDGAMQFDNHTSAQVVIKPATAATATTSPATTSSTTDATFLVRDGITIEVLMIPKWTAQGWSTRTAANPDGSPFDYDQIFRKEDADRRILLSFQNDLGGQQVVIPVVDPGPCLTFGLNLEGIGYNEMDMRLDGISGRPTLAELQDGKPHHLVATYDAATGLKAIYIDGTLRFRHRFPPGTRIVTGGNNPAIIGNSQPQDEPFNGVLDEFAFYDFALTPAEVAGHWRNVQAGRNYFGAVSFEKSINATPANPSTHAAIIPIHAGEAMSFDRHTGLRTDDLPADEKSFTP